MAVRYDFPVDGEYAIKVRLRRQYQDYIMGMGWPQQLDVRLDGALAQAIHRRRRGARAGLRPPVTPATASRDLPAIPSGKSTCRSAADAGLEVRMPIDGGPRIVGVSFVREMWEPEGLPQPLQRGRVLTNDQIYMGYASVGAVSIGGPVLASPARRRTRRAAGRFSSASRATRIGRARRAPAKILLAIARLAYRRPADDADVADAARVLRSTDGATAAASTPAFSSRSSGCWSIPTSCCACTAIRRRRGGAASASDLSLSDLELASRLSFFLWSSIPDERLLDVAERGQLTKPEVLEQQVRRMLADPRATTALVDNFARAVAEPAPRATRSSSIRTSIRTSTTACSRRSSRRRSCFSASTLREDRSVLDLLRADYTFVNERLARHYGIPGIYGSRFRRVTLPNLDQRGGLLGNGAMLATTSYPDRTSPVLRGKWLLDNIFGTPPPPPPPGVDTTLAGAEAPARCRRRFANGWRSIARIRRARRVMRSIDPLGFALENFDAIGGWRTVDESGKPVDASGGTVSGDTVDGLRVCGRCCSSSRNDFRAPSPRSCWRTRSAAASSTTIGRPCARSCATRPPTTTAGRRSFVGIVKSPAFLMRARPRRRTGVEGATCLS